LFPIPGESPYVISFSGLLEEVDEAVCLALGYEIGVTTDETARRIIAVSNNQVFPEMLEAYRASR